MPRERKDPMLASSFSVALELDALDVALQVATSELDMRGETTFAKIQFDDGSSQNLDNFSATFFTSLSSMYWKTELQIIKSIGAYFK